MSKITVLTNTFPKRSETFVIRHAVCLDATVTAGSLNNQMLSEIGFENEIYPLGANAFKPGKFQRIRSRLFGSSRTCRMASKTQRVLEEMWTSHRPKAVLAEFGPNGIRANQVCPKLGLPFVIHFHGYDTSSLIRDKNYLEDIREAIQKASSVIGVSTQMAKIIVDELGCPKEKLHIIPVGAPVSEFPIVERRKGGIFNFLAVGRMVPKKSPLSSIKAFEICHRSNRNTRLTFIGDGPLLQIAKKYVASRNLVDCVNFLGATPFQIVRQHMLNSSCFIQHSVTSKSGDTEGWPTAIAEAMAAQLPVVATRHAGIVDQIDHGVTGFLIDEHDVDGMAEYMTRLANDFDLAKQLGCAGRKRIEKVGDSDKLGKKIAQLFRQES